MFFDKEPADIFPNLFQDPIADNLMQESSSLPLEFYHDIPIFDKYSDEEEYFKVGEDLSTYGISSSSTFQQRDDQKHVHPVVDDGYEFVDQNPSDISYKEIVSCNRPTYHHDEFKLQRYGERDKKCSDQKLSLQFPLTKVE